MKNKIIACVVAVACMFGGIGIASANHRVARLRAVVTAPFRGAKNVLENRPVRKFLSNKPVRTVLFGRGCN